MHVSDDVLLEIQSILSYCVEGFPQAYLGLPLSCHNLKMEDFTPIIAKADTCLSWWRAQLLSFGGRLLLINALLDALPTYAMAAMELSPTIIMALDGLHLSFLWREVDHLSGAQCLIAWEQVCRPKGEGGLGIGSLHD